MVDLTFSLLSPSGFVSSAAYLVLAFLFLIDSTLYFRCAITCLRQVQLVKETSGPQQQSGGGHRRASSAPGRLASERQFGSSISTLPPYPRDRHQRRSQTKKCSSIEVPVALNSTTAAFSPSSPTPTGSGEHHRSHSLGAEPICSTVFCERMVGANRGSLLPLQADGIAEMLNVLASTVSMYSALVTLAVTDDNWTENVLSADLLSSIIWLVDSFCYFRAWQTSLPEIETGLKRFWRPTSAWYWANILNCAASVVYVVVAAVALSTAGERRDEVVMEQRAMFALGDVLYLLCALMCHWAWQLDGRASAVAPTPDGEVRSV